MTWVSYAQNYEDVVLARVLEGVLDGFWIDVGAHDPRMDSVTCAFAERGWRGINLEPVPRWHARLAAARPRDVNLRIAAGDREGAMRFFEVADSGLSTGNADFAARHRAGRLAVREMDVPVRPLAAVCADHVRGPVHFLKVDAEGTEAAVLRGMDFEAVRPWVVLVEATEPNSRVSTHAQWEPALLSQGYAFAYDDGINRYYLARERGDLADRFGPPTVLDDFVRREQVDAVAAVEARAADVDALSRRRAAELESLVARIADKDAELAGWHARWQAEAELASRLQDELREAAAREFALRQEHDAVAARDAAGSKDLDRMHREAAVLQSALADSIAREAELLAGLERLAAAEAAQRAEAARGHEAGVALQSEVDRLAGEGAALASALDRMRAESGVLASELHRMHHEVAVLRAACSESAAREAELRDAHARLRQQADAARSALGEAAAREAGLRAQAGRERLDASVRAADLESELAASRADADAARAATLLADARVAAAERAVARLSLQVPDLQAQLRAADAAHAIAHAELLRHVDIIASLRDEQSRVLRSRSWRITAPLRGVNAWLASWRARARIALRAVERRPAVRAIGKQVLQPFPALRRRVARRLTPGPWAANVAERAPDLPLTEDAVRILAHAPVLGDERD